MTAATLTRPTTRDWRHDAACRDEDPEMFFPNGSNTWEGATQIVMALSVCHRCPVQRPCLAAALKVPARDRKVQVIGGRWMDAKGVPHATAPIPGAHPDNWSDDTEETR